MPDGKTYATVLSIPELCLCAINLLSSVAVAIHGYGDYFSLSRGGRNIRQLLYSHYPTALILTIWVKFFREPLHAISSRPLPLFRFAALLERVSFEWKEKHFVCLARYCYLGVQAVSAIRDTLQLVKMTV